MGTPLTLSMRSLNALVALLFSLTSVFSQSCTCTGHTFCPGHPQSSCDFYSDKTPYFCVWACDPTTSPTTAAPISTASPTPSVAYVTTSCETAIFDESIWIFLFLGIALVFPSYRCFRLLLHSAEKAIAKEIASKMTVSRVLARRLIAIKASCCTSEGPDEKRLEHRSRFWKGLVKTIGLVASLALKILAIVVIFLTSADLKSARDYRDLGTFDDCCYLVVNLEMVCSGYALFAFGSVVHLIYYGFFTACGHNIFVPFARGWSTRFGDNCANGFLAVLVKQWCAMAAVGISVLGFYGSYDVGSDCPSIAGVETQMSDVNDGFMYCMGLTSLAVLIELLLVEPIVMHSKQKAYDKAKGIESPENSPDVEIDDETDIKAEVELSATDQELAEKYKNTYRNQDATNTQPEILVRPTDKFGEKPTESAAPSVTQEEITPEEPTRPSMTHEELAQQIKKCMTGRIYCGRDIAGRYTDGPNRFCTQLRLAVGDKNLEDAGLRLPCSCDGKCGPSGGCQCEDCYDLTYPEDRETKEMGQLESQNNDLSAIIFGDLSDK